MSEMTDWFQNNWIDLARLLVQCAILAAVVRYGRKLLATMRASQEQVGALLRLSVSDTVAEQPAGSPAPEMTGGYEPPALTPAPNKRFEEPAPAAEPSRSYEPASLRFREPEPEPEREPEPEPEPVFAGGGFSRDSYAAQREQSLGGRVIGTPAPAISAPAPVFSAAVARTESPSLTPWVSAPAVEPERLSTPVAPPIAARAGVSSWLQAPMRSGGASPWRKMVRWLQAPAGH
jgi:hypothetical protein